MVLRAIGLAVVTIWIHCPDGSMHLMERNYHLKYLSNDWNTLLPLNLYSESTSDSRDYEEGYTGETSPVFPHKVWTMSKNSLK
jgi:hypothetical protein